MTTSRKIALAFFVVMALSQLFVPARMIRDREEVLHSGVDYKFKTAPIDPNDPFRGKYITLSYEAVIAKIEEEEDWEWGETTYVLLENDSLGYAQIRAVSKAQPSDTDNFVKATISFVSADGSNELMVEYPFDRFYMEESKAYAAEELYRESTIDSSIVAYALVSVKNGDAVVKDVLIDGVSVVDLAQANRSRD